MTDDTACSKRTHLVILSVGHCRLGSPRLDVRALLEGKSSHRAFLLEMTSYDAALHGPTLLILLYTGKLPSLPKAFTFTFSMMRLFFVMLRQRNGGVAHD